MSEFDPYHKWLGIPPEEQPAHHYRLLGITDFEVDRDTISAAAEQRTIYLRTLQSGEYEVLVAELLNEVSQARVTLLNVDQKAAYDEELRKQQTPEPEPEPTPPPIPVVQTPAPLQNIPPPTPVADREPSAQNRPQSIAADWSTFQPTKKPRGKVQKKNWKRPAVIGVSVVGGIGVFVLLISLMSSGDAGPVASNLPPVVTSPSITNTIGMSLKEIPAGTFMMGSPETEKDRDGDEPQHKVTITKPFYMQTTEVTQGQWKAVMGTEPWKGKEYAKEGPDYAASFVSWDAAVAYCKKLSEAEGKTYRLPTEAEWEYACRAGTQTTWSFGNDEKELGDYAWYDENVRDIGEEYAHQVRLKKPSAFGLYDIHGNVFEWCYDYYGEDYYKQSPEKDPPGPASGSFRVVRGGSWWRGDTPLTRSASRDKSTAGDSNFSSGFRLVRELD
ncbi:MAG: formylglycine-generating enzyme family protein [Pseudomonadales bacterium]|nr:formylglycine-generating enzyme family protein [Pseudomonadales bacterium]